MAQKQNINIVDKPLPKYKGRQILKVLQKTIGEDEVLYKCIMEDGEIIDIPADVIDEGGEK